ncbi:hypothetical protein AVEN_35404-1 [Araneus ventricosus]|uniref:Uncharacterized protein n=1 Tax=Araneus ventricosus TaxID=182803 RepID=A0A4Y2N7I8_ARAVE|nr:hypothetical protein AVEN_35404-1 [Araneus ventricosus]
MTIIIINYSRTFRKDETQVTEGIALVQISNASKQQISNNSSSLAADQLAIRTRLQRESSCSEEVPRRILLLNFHRVPDRVCRHMETSEETRISAPNRDIEKVIAFSGIFDLSPSCRNGIQGQGSKLGSCRHSILTPVKLSFQP